MVVDTSAIVAIILREQGYLRLEDVLERAGPIVVSAPILFKASMVLTTRLGRDPQTVISAFLERTRAEIVAFDSAHLRVAIAAFHRYGKGRHPARLNFGDCMSYAAARVSRQPLLFTGD